MGRENEESRIRGRQVELVKERHSEKEHMEERAGYTRKCHVWLEYVFGEGEGGGSGKTMGESECHVEKCGCYSIADGRPRTVCFLSRDVTRSKHIRFFLYPNAKKPTFNITCICCCFLMNATIQGCVAKNPNNYGNSF